MNWSEHLFLSFDCIHYRTFNFFLSETFGNIRNKSEISKQMYERGV